MPEGRGRKKFRLEPVLGDSLAPNMHFTPSAHPAKLALFSSGLDRVHIQTLSAGRLNFVLFFLNASSEIAVSACRLNFVLICLNLSEFWACLNLPGALPRPSCGTLAVSCTKKHRPEGARGLLTATTPA